MIGKIGFSPDKISETATGFTCFMDTVIRASSFENVSKKILIPFNVNKTIKNKLLNKGFTVFTFFNETKNIKKEAKNYGCNFYLEDMKVKSI